MFSQREMKALSSWRVGLFGLTDSMVRGRHLGASVLVTRGFAQWRWSVGLCAVAVRCLLLTRSEVELTTSCACDRPAVTLDELIFSRMICRHPVT